MQTLSCSSHVTRLQGHVESRKWEKEDVSETHGQEDEEEEDGGDGLETDVVVSWLQS